MTLFISYSSVDASTVAALERNLEAFGKKVWRDKEVTGGQAWWTAILQQIRECDVFIFAVSVNSLDSDPCALEVNYAKALGRPILPVEIGDVDADVRRNYAVYSDQLVDYRNPTTEAAIALMRAISELEAVRNPLPDPLPPEPPIPYEYLLRLSTVIRAREPIPYLQQRELIGQFRDALARERNPSVRGSMRKLLRELADRPEISHSVEAEVAELLAKYPPAEAERNDGTPVNGRGPAGQAPAMPPADPAKPERPTLPPEASAETPARPAPVSEPAAEPALVQDQTAVPVIASEQPTAPVPPLESAAASVAVPEQPVASVLVEQPAAPALVPGQQPGSQAPWQQPNPLAYASQPPAAPPPAPPPYSASPPFIGESPGGYPGAPTGSAATFAGGPPPSPPRKNHGLAIALGAVGGVAVLGGIAAGAIALTMRGTTPEPSPTAAATVECWDGQTAEDASLCADFSGEDAVMYAFSPEDGSGDAAADCDGVTPSADETADGMTVVVYCTWPDIPGTNLRIAQWDRSAGGVTSYWTGFATWDDEYTWTVEDTRVGLTWELATTLDSGDVWMWAAVYDDLPFSLDILASASSGGSAETMQDVWDRIYALDVDQIAALPATP